MPLDFAFLDSGTGGLPYMGYLKEVCPGASCLYLADTKNFPYGEKTPSQVVAATVETVELILSRFQPRAFVLACNTMSVTALDILRTSFPENQFIGTVPAIKVAVTKTKNKTIGLLATDATVNHPYTCRLVQDFATTCRVVSRGDGTLIRFIENHLLEEDRSPYLEATKPAVEFFLSKGVDTIVLGCTHFLHIVQEIQQLAGPHVQVVDSREGVIRQALRVALGQKSDCGQKENCRIKAQGKEMGQSFFVSQLTNSAMEDYYRKLCQQFSIQWGGLLK